MDEKITHLENRQSQCCGFFLGFEVCPPPHLSPSKYVYPTVDIIFIPIIYNIINAVYINRYICSLLKGCYYIEHRLSTST